MQAKHPNYQQVVREIFHQAPFIQELGIQIDHIEVGRIETSLDIQPKHLQQNGYVHAGVQATIADHTAGACAGTLVGEDEFILTVEFKINLLRPALGERLTCIANVLKPGHRFSIVESEVFAHTDDTSKLVAKATVTLAHVAK